MATSGGLKATAAMLAAAGILLSGFGAPSASPPGSEAAAHAVAAVAAPARTKAPATVSATYSISATGAVQVSVVSNAKYVKLGWKSATGRTMTKKVRVRGGRARVALPAGSTRLTVRALGTSRLFASGWVAAAAETPGQPAAQGQPVVQDQPTTATPPVAAGAVVPADAPGDYSFLGTQPSDPSSPVGWSPCEPIRVRIDPGDANLGVSPAELALMQAAIASLAAASRLPVSFAGQTRDQSPDPADTEIIVRFLAGPLEDGAAGYGGYSSRSYLRAADRAVWQFIDYGHVEVSVGEISRANPQQRQELYMHELAHAIGLGHASSTSQIMYGIDDNPGVEPAWGSGDLAGMAVLAAAPCRASN